MIKKIKGFTLIELIIVIAIITILVAIIVPKASRLIENSKVIVFEDNIKKIQTLAISEYTEMGEVVTGIIMYDGKVNEKYFLKIGLNSLSNPFNIAQYELIIIDSEYCLRLGYDEYSLITDRVLVQLEEKFPNMKKQKNYPFDYFIFPLVSLE